MFGKDSEHCIVPQTLSGMPYTMLSDGKGIARHEAAAKKEEIMKALLAQGCPEVDINDRICR